MKQNATKIFNKMKGTKSHYFRTLLDGEDKGHCHGIKKRMDPTTKYRLKQQMHKYQQIQEERIEEIRQLKKEKEMLKLQQKRNRV